ncbi:MAG: hypothetical protein JSU63_19930 [Phycisphaerales bacterium]|nr:MAG: hypothetical protein JSU63_19930 [Phycisphaerales bacterium]
MTIGLSSSIIMIAVVLAPTVEGPDDAPEAYHSTAYGYHLEVPPGWVEIPKDAMEMMSAFLLNQDVEQKIIHDAGFQLASAGHWLEYPYVLVQPVMYADYGLHRQINEDEFPRHVQLMTGLDVDELTEDALSSHARQLLVDLDAERPELDVVRRRYLWHLNMDAKGFGPVRGLIAGHFGRDSVVQVAFYSLRSDWDRYAEVRSAIIDSFRFDPEKAYSIAVAQANPTPPPRWHSVLRGALIGAIVGALWGVIGMMKRKRKVRT